MQIIKGGYKFFKGLLSHPQNRRSTSLSNLSFNNHPHQPKSSLDSKKSAQKKIIINQQNVSLDKNCIDKDIDKYSIEAIHQEKSMLQEFFENNDNFEHIMKTGTLQNQEEINQTNQKLNSLTKIEQQYPHLDLKQNLNILSPKSKVNDQKCNQNQNIVKTYPKSQKHKKKLQQEVQTTYCNQDLIYANNQNPSEILIQNDKNNEINKDEIDKYNSKKRKIPNFKKCRYQMTTNVSNSLLIFKKINIRHNKLIDTINQNCIVCKQKICQDYEQLACTHKIHKKCKFDYMQYRMKYNCKICQIKPQIIKN